MVGSCLRQREGGDTVMNKYRVFISETHPVVTVDADRIEVRGNGSIIFYELMGPMPVRYDVDADERIVAVYPTTCIVELIP